MKKYIVIVALILGLFGGSLCLAQPNQVSAEAKFFYNQGIDYYKNGQYDRSMEAFRKAIDTDANYVDAYYNLASILEYLHQDEEALAIFKKIIVRSPNDYDAIYRTAELSHKLGYQEQAKTYLSLIPNNSVAFQKASNLANLMGLDLQTIKEDKKQAEKNAEIQQQNDSNGIYSQIESPTGVVMDSEGNLFVASFSENVIYKITPDGKRMINIKDSRLSGPIGIVMDSQDNLYVANYNKDNILKISSGGQIDILLSNVQKPYILFVRDNMLYISSQGASAVIRYKLY